MISTHFHRMTAPRTALSLVSGAVAIWAAAGALGLATGALAVSAELEGRLPWQSPTLAATGLALVVAVPMTLVAVLATQDDHRCARAAIAAGFALVAWILAQIVLLRELSWLQPVCILAAIGVAALGMALQDERARL
ncbi:hypothetical protein BOX37_15650 [Nocardia mangyaensis]|uniref:Uncharacterized protein n=1 Tax=Nocardia mangyaensis TaxID=2213200 RepID=A0A1J0VT01_9NOCA|nr:hypothetical protein [Nocardia mangyaensis]APE35145.1 hypothetical protein BOX37_15650 [Nocardia mangyaensis]